MKKHSRVFGGALILAVCIYNCSGPKTKSKENRSDIEVNNSSQDSLSASHRAFAAFSKSVSDCKDSIRKYHVESMNDTCIKYLYVMYGPKKLKRNDSLTVGECAIKLTGFQNISDQTYKLRYSLFVRDSVPIVANLIDDAIIHTFEYNVAQQKISKAYLGQETSYMADKELKDAFFYSLNKKENLAYLTKDSAKLNPEFIRLIAH